MPQTAEWDREYRKSQFLTKDNKPQSDTVRFARFLKKEKGMSLSDIALLDLGCGTGRNSFYFAEYGARVTGCDISRTAIGIARERALAAGLHIRYDIRSMGESFPYNDGEYDIVLDVTSSNSLSESERNIYLAETHRVLRHGGYMFVKALCKEGDPNAAHLLKHNPGPEKDTYELPGIHIIERVWSKEDLERTYGTYFVIERLEKKTSYSRMAGRLYKRNFWILYMRKK